jgi:pyruvate formate lyase activating enzyme
MAESLATLLDRQTRPGTLLEQLPNMRVRCVACGHRCVIPPGRRGVCQVRFNEAGTLRVPWGYVAGVNVDPVEKKPFFHVLPGAKALSFGMLGCDYHCAYCQNWLSSQALRDPEAGTPTQLVSPDDLVQLALRRGAPIMTSTYNEPLITSEWAVSIFQRARAAGLLCSYVSNGNATPEVLDLLAPWLTLYKVDLKSFRDGTYRRLGGTLERVQWTIAELVRRTVWVEVVTLLVPGLNDSREELADMARFLASISPDIPWHVTAFHRDYRLHDHADTDVRGLLRAAEIGVEAGLRHVYVGNLPGSVDGWENTRCPSCGVTLVERCGFRILDDRIGETGACPDCGQKIAGVWQTPASLAPHGERAG